MAPVGIDADVRTRLVERMRMLREDTPRKWGSMTPAQMVWHLNSALANACGDVEYKFRGPRNGVVRSLVRFFVLRAPWPKGVPTAPEMTAGPSYDLEAERARFEALIGRVGCTRADGSWPVHPAFGQMDGRDWCKLEVRHIDHHLRQFGL